MGEDSKKPPAEAVSDSAEPLLKSPPGDKKGKRTDFKGHVLIVDNSEVHILGIRALLKSIFEIDEKNIHSSTARTEALKIAGAIDDRLLLISDVYTHSDINAAEFVQKLRSLRDRIYIAIYTGKEKKALREMPRLNPSAGLVTKFVSKDNDLDNSFRQIFEDFISDRWEKEPSKDDSPAEKSPEIEHTWEEAKLFLPEERKQYLSERVIISGEDLLRRFKNFELPSGYYDLTADNEKIIEALAEETDQFAARLCKPVSEKLIAAVNKNRDEEKQLSMQDVRELYFYRDTDGLFNAITDFKGQKSPENIRKITDELEAHVDSAKNKLQEMGGDSEETLIRVLSEYNIDEHSKWHNDFFGEIETRLYSDILKMLMARFQIPVEEIRIDDRGCGTGRCFKQLIRLITQGIQSKDGASQEFPVLTDENKIRKFASGYYGIDKMGCNVAKTRRVIRETVFPGIEGAIVGIDKENITVGDFHDILPIEQQRRFSPGDIHFSICMMRTSLHNITEEELIHFLYGLERDLKPGTEDNPGGIALIDTVQPGVSPRAINDIDIQRNLDDLSDFYIQLSVSYAEQYQKFMPEGIDLRRMPRLPIYDNTTGCGFYPREIIDPEYIRYVLSIAKDINLEVLRTPRNQVSDKCEAKEEAVKLGRKWIKDNELECRYRKEIQRRTDEKIVNPSKLLGREIMPNEDVIELLLDHVAYRMVSEFASTYIVLQRPKKKKEPDTGKA